MKLTLINCIFCKGYSDIVGIKDNKLICERCLECPSIWVIENSSIYDTYAETLRTEYS